MVLEIAEYTAAPGKAEELQAGLARAREIIRGAQGCRAIALRRCVEEPERFIFTIEWETIEDHTVTFRGGPLFPQYRAQIAGLVEGAIVARHYQTVEG
ncbi:MAG TPA: antibiotic biosynthesis monooxygenase family protein [Ktedonobacterales bacterium]|nr:antibiotic biosynthesis monooxygenase family protein [Ktedonobacterales bacterium]